MPIIPSAIHLSVNFYTAAVCEIASVEQYQLFGQQPRKSAYYRGRRDKLVRILHGKLRAVFVIQQDSTGHAHLIHKVSRSHLMALEITFIARALSSS